MDRSPPIDWGLWLEMLAHGPPEERRRAVAHLEVSVGLNVPKSLDVVLRALEDADWSVRERAALALGAVAYPAAHQALRRAAFGRRRDRDPRVRAAVATSLARLGGDENLAVLLRMLDDRAREPRRTAAYGVGRLRAVAAIPPLLRLGRFHDPALRAVAVWSLGAIGPAPGESARRTLLVRSLTDPVAMVRRLAAEALGCLGESAAVDPLIAVLEDPDAGVRQEAARSLGRIGNARALPPLRARRALWREANGEVRAACRAAVARLEELERFQTPEVVPAMSPGGDGREVSPG